MKPIPQEWVKHYVDQLLKWAQLCPEGKLRDATLLRADHAMDLVKAFREASCPGHVASDDPKICAYCGVHIDELRPDDET